MIIHHLKRHFKHPLSLLLYALLLVYFLMSGTLLNRNQLSTLSVDIAVVDRAENDITKNYIAKLQKQPILSLHKTNYAEAETLLKREVVDALMIIPENYNPNQKGDRISYYHLQTNVLAPAAIDLLAVDIMPEIVKHRLVKAANRYRIGDQESALNHFNKYQETVKEQLTVRVLPIGKQDSPYREQTLIVVNSAKKQLLFSLFVIVLCLALPLSVLLTTSATTLRRIAVSSRGIAIYGFSERLVSYLYLLLPWLIVCLSLTTVLNESDGALLIAVGGVIIIAYFEAFKLLINSLKNKSTASLAALLTLIIPALLGGVFFDTDLLPAGIYALSSALPFNLMESAFYVELSTQVNGYHANVSIAYTLLACGLIALNSLSIRRRSHADSSH